MIKILKTLLLLLLSLFLCSCNPVANSIPSDIMSDLLLAYNESANTALFYISGADENSDNYLSLEKFSNIYGFNDEEGSFQYSLFKDYAVLITKEMSLFEIHIVKATHLSDCDDIIRVFENRKKLMKKSVNLIESQYDYKDIVENITITKKGYYVYMFVTNNNDIANALI